MGAVHAAIGRGSLVGHRDGMAGFCSHLARPSKLDGGKRDGEDQQYPSEQDHGGKLGRVAPSGNGAAPRAIVAAISFA